MELRQFEYFVAVTDEASFTRAAAGLHVAQPGVSAQIRRLERELGQPLFDRSGRTVRLTEVGRAVLPFARAALEAVNGARLAVDELTGLVRGQVAVGMVASCGALPLPAVLAGFHRRHPAVEISLTEANSDVLLDDVLAGRLDLAVVGLAAGPPEGIAIQVVVDERLVAAVAPDDPLADAGTVRLAALRDRALITLTRGPVCAPPWTTPARAPVSGRVSPSRRATRPCSPTSPLRAWGWRYCPSRSRRPARRRCSP